MTISSIFCHPSNPTCLQSFGYLWYDDVIKWKYFPRYWPFLREIHWSPVNSPHKGQWRRALMFPLFCAWINGWANNREAGDLRLHRAHHDVTIMTHLCIFSMITPFIAIFELDHAIHSNNACANCVHNYTDPINKLTSVNWQSNLSSCARDNQDGCVI